MSFISSSKSMGWSLFIKRRFCVYLPIFCNWINKQIGTEIFIINPI